MILLQIKIGRLILFLACRLHIFEIVLEAVFDYFLGPSGGPEILLFKRFRMKWNSIRKDDFSAGVDDHYVRNALGERVQEILAFAHAQINVSQLRFKRNHRRLTLRLF